MYCFLSQVTTQPNVPRSQNNLAQSENFKRVAWWIALGSLIGKVRDALSYLRAVVGKSQPCKYLRMETRTISRELVDLPRVKYFSGGNFGKSGKSQMSVLQSMRIA